MKTIPDTLLADYWVSPEQLADKFWAMDDREQAAFFNHLGVLALATPSPFSRDVGSFFPLDWQMYHAAQHALALPLGRRVMEIIGENTSVSMLQPYEREDTRYRNLPTRGLR